MSKEMMRVLIKKLRADNQQLKDQLANNQGISLDKDTEVEDEVEKFLEFFEREAKPLHQKITELENSNQKLEEEMENFYNNHFDSFFQNMESQRETLELQLSSLEKENEKIKIESELELEHIRKKFDENLRKERSNWEQNLKNQRRNFEDELRIEKIKNIELNSKLEDMLIELAEKDDDYDLEIQSLSNQLKEAKYKLKNYKLLQNSDRRNIEVNCSNEDLENFEERQVGWWESLDPMRSLRQSSKIEIETRDSQNSQINIFNREDDQVLLNLSPRSLEPENPRLTFGETQTLEFLEQSTQTEENLETMNNRDLFKEELDQIPILSAEICQALTEKTELAIKLKSLSSKNSILTSKNNSLSAEIKRKEQWNSTLTKLLEKERELHGAAVRKFSDKKAKYEDRISNIEVQFYKLVRKKISRRENLQNICEKEDREVNELIDRISAKYSVEQGSKLGNHYARSRLRVPEDFEKENTNFNGSYKISLYSNNSAKKGCRFVKKFKGGRPKTTRKFKKDDPKSTFLE